MTTITETLKNLGHTVSQAYGLEPKKGDRPLKIFENNESGWEGYVPNIKPHIFSPDMVNDLREFDLSGYKDGGLFITGPKGAGKSSSVEQFYARMGKPVFRANGHERMEVSELIGQMTLVNQSTVFSHGPLTLAAKFGGVFLLDEGDACPPEVLVGLHGIMEMGSKFVIPENGGEIIHIHPEFRFIVTGNTAGSGDESGNYAGTMIQNSATLDRFNFLSWGYPRKEVEVAIVMAADKMFEKSKLLIEQLVDAAIETRLGGIEEISTRTLIRWARKAVVYRSAGKSLKYSLDRAFAHRLDEFKRAELYAKMRLVFGEQFME